LQGSPDEGQEGEDPLRRVGERSAVLGVVNVDEGVGDVEARGVGEVVQRADERGQLIGDEELSEPFFGEGREDDASDAAEEEDACVPIEDGERVEEDDQHDDEEDEVDDARLQRNEGRVGDLGDDGSGVERQREQVQESEAAGELPDFRVANLREGVGLENEHVVDSDEKKGRERKERREKGGRRKASEEMR
jgi:hypothetical protein